MPTQYILIAKDLDTIVRDWPEDWKHEGSLPFAEKSTQQADATMPRQAQPDQPQPEPPTKPTKGGTKCISSTRIFTKEAKG